MSADGLIDGAWNPITNANDLTVTVDGGRLDHFQRYSLSGFLDAQHIPATVTQPGSVFEAVDGDWLYFRRVDTLPKVVPRHVRNTVPRAVFMVRIRQTGARAFVWSFEPADEVNPDLPQSRGRDRIKKRLR